MPSKRDDRGGGWVSSDARDAAARRLRRPQSEPRADPRPDRDTDEIRDEMRTTSDGLPLIRDFEDTGITQRIRDDPELSRLYTKIEHLKVRMIDDAKTNADRIMSAIGNGSFAEKAKELEEDISTMRSVVDLLKIDVATTKSSLGIGRWILGIVVVAAFASLGTVIATVWGKGEQAGEAAIRLQHLERDIETLRSAVYSRQTHAPVSQSNQNSWDFPIPKGSNAQ
jgi:hypothetical protein